MENHFKTLIEKALESTPQEQFDKLKEIYHQIPAGTCAVGCAKCCMESVETHYIEFLHIVKYLKEHEGLWEKAFPKILHFYFHELKVKMPCPFLEENNQCMIYEVRPYPCRLYGHLSEKQYEESYERIKKESMETANVFLLEYKVNIAQEVLNYKVPYCLDFKISNKLSKESINNMMDNILSLEFVYFMEGYIELNEISYSLVGWFMKLFFLEEEMGTLRMGIMKELEKRESSSLFDEIFSKYSNKILEK